jgi:hypothetical protein
MVANKENTAIVVDKDAHTLSDPHTSWKKLDAPESASLHNGEIL